MFDEKEIKQWEDGVAFRRQVTRKKVTRISDPRRKKLNDFRNHRKTKHFYSNEVKWIRKLTQRRFRAKFQSHRFNENAVKPVPHEYKTYGWLSW